VDLSEFLTLRRDKLNQSVHRSVLVILDVEGLSGRGQVSDAARSVSVGLGTHHEGVLSCLDVLRLPAPSLESRRLEGTSERERKGPRPLDVLDLVHGRQVSGGGLLALPTTQEDNARDGRGDSPGERTDGEERGSADVSLVSLGAGKDHVRLEKAMEGKRASVRENLRT
jgi:hypothetical protein